MRSGQKVSGRKWISKLARVGLTAKGVVYLVLGILAFMAAFELGGQSNTDANRTGVFTAIRDAPAGLWLLGLLSAGLICYCVWRGVQAFARDKDLKWTKRLRYLFSGLAYLSVAITAIQIILHTYTDNGDSNRNIAAQLLDTNHGKWLLGGFALFIAGTGFYQVWYGLSEKYKKHVQKLSAQQSHSILLYSGKVGYLARGAVWLVIAFLLIKAALHANASEAGDSSKAFRFVENTQYGSYLLGALGVGLMAYGVFNFIRARYESFQ